MDHQQCLSAKKWSILTVIAGRGERCAALVQARDARVPARKHGGLAGVCAARHSLHACMHTTMPCRARPRQFLNHWT